MPLNICVITKTIIILCLCNNVWTESKGGYPSGFLGDCPGSNNEAIITEKSLKYLVMTVERGNGVPGRGRKYTHSNIKELAKDPNIDLKKRTVMYIGGYLETTNFFYATAITESYIKLGYNVMLLDTHMFTAMEYPVAARFMYPVAMHAAGMLLNLTREGLDPKKLELIGISLGAQTAGLIAKNYRILTGVTVSRVTGLDPAGPCFRNLGPEKKIDRSDADFVDIVATNIDGYGMAAPVGHVNFYVNGGEYQPGGIWWIYCDLICSHTRSFNIWLSALEYLDSFIAIQCDSVEQARMRGCYDRELVTNVVGLNTNRSREGIFYLSTDSKYPFYLGDKGLKREFDFMLSLIKGFNEKGVIKI